MRDIANEIAAENERLKRAEGTWKPKGKFISDCTETLAGMHAIYDETDNFVAAFLFPEARDRAVKAVNHAATERAEWIDLSAGLLSAAQSVLRAWEQSEKHNPANTALQLNGPIGELYGAVMDMDRKARESEAPRTNEQEKGARALTTELPAIVRRAMTETVTDIGQLSKSDIYQLNKYVRKGWLSRGKGGPFSILKTVYACPGFDFAASREQYVEAAMATYEIEKRLRASGYFDPCSPNYGIDLAEQKG